MNLYERVEIFESYTDYSIRHGIGTVLDILGTSELTQQLRNKPVPSTWFVSPAKKNSFLVSAELGDSNSAASIILTESEDLQVCPAPWTQIGAITPANRDPGGYVAKVIPTEEIAHVGTHLFQVDFGEDTPAINVITTWTSDAPVLPVYLKINDSDKTARARLLAITSLEPPNTGLGRRRQVSDANQMDDALLEYRQEVAEAQDEQNGGSHSGPVSTSFSLEDKNKDLRDLLVGGSALRLNMVNFILGLNQKQLNQLREFLTPHQAVEFISFIREVPKGLLIISGPPGSGKTTAGVAASGTRLLANEAVLGVASANSATTNYHLRMQKSPFAKGKLLQRLYPIGVEARWLSKADPDTVESMLRGLPSSGTQLSKRQKRYIFDGSAAHTVLKMVGVCPTDNPVLLELGKQHQELGELLRLPADSAKRMHETPEIAIYRQLLYKNALIDLMGKIDMLFCTSTVGADSIAKVFRARASMITFDEAAAAQEAEVLMVWDGHQALVLAGDPTQLRPVVMSEKLRDGQGRNINPLALQLKNSLMARLIQRGWPHWHQSQQLRMPCGMFAPAIFATYDKHTYEYADLCDLQKAPRKFIVARNIAEWASRRFPHMKKAPAGHVWPFLIDVTGSYSHKALRGTSRGNTAIAHHVLHSVEKMIRETKGVQLSHFVILVPYLEQLRIYNCVKFQSPAFKELRVYTIDSFQSQEAPIIMLDTTMGSNMPGMGGFMNKQRVATGTTRQTEYLIVFMDSGCFASAGDLNELGSDYHSPATEGTTQKPFVMEMGALRKLYEWFEIKGRLIYKDGTPRASQYLEIIHQADWEEKLLAFEKQREKTWQVYESEGYIKGFADEYNDIAQAGINFEVGGIQIN